MKRQNFAIRKYVFMDVNAKRIQVICIFISGLSFLMHDITLSDSNVIW